LRPVAEAQLREHVADMRLEGLLGDHEGVGDLGVGQPAGDQLEHFGLPGGQPFQRRHLATEVGWP
jgi:hypothetical protein